MKSGCFLLFLILLIVPKYSDSQELTISFSDIGKSTKYKFSSEVKIDSSFIARTLYQHLIPLYNKGYLAATIDSFSIDSKGVKAYGVMGSKYKLVKVKADSLSQLELNELGIRIPSYEGKTLNPQRFSKLAGFILKRFEDSGFPFIKVRLDSIRIKQNRIDATLFIDRGSKITIDTLYLKGDAKVKYRYILALLNVKKNELYSESKIKAIDQKLSQQSYLSIIKPTEVEFLNHTARLYTYLSSRNASRFSGLAGFFTDEKDGKIKLNGDLNLSLVNTMRSGERLSFAWNAPGKGTQNLNIETDWPYIFGSQVGVTGNLSLYKRDSTYITINPRVSLNFYSNGRGRFLVNLDFKKTSISATTVVQQSQYKNSSALLYGVGYEFNGLNNQVLPSKGFYFKSSVNTGSRKLTQVSGSSNLVEGEILVRGFIPVYENRFVIAFCSNSKLRALYKYDGGSKFYDNELYRIGGMGTIRGFNQETVLSSAYSIATAEVHLRVSEGSGFFLFADKAFVKSYELGVNKDSWPLGLGIGINLVTKAGLFNLSYAVGDGFGQSMGLKDAKVHFGIVALF